MGSSGAYYDRDVSVVSKLSSGVSTFAQEQMSRSVLSNDLLPFERKLVSAHRNPLVYVYDVTGSMGTLPKLIYDKMPMIAGQIVEQKYLEDPDVSLAAVGDVTSDRGPLQVCDFSVIKSLDPWLQKIWIEGGGGGQHFESYEFMAYFYARCCDMPNAQLPILLFTGDEGFREQLLGSELKKRFGGQHENINTSVIFAELKAKFMDNVFLLHRYYNNYGLDSEIVAQWEKVLGKNYVIKLPDDTAIADLTLGILALVSGKRTLSGYVEDMKNRPLEMGGKKYKPQTQERINQVTEALKPLETMLKEKNVQKKKDGPVNPAQSQKNTSKKGGGLKV
ncbi:MAG: hypothetical protein HYX21_00930 [Candidatus Yanofskybacteria bacterium]|nr:hypothetical protein [Candidatus Yanofskybacteria bacterium]